jgi:hypothetical protein
MQFHPIHPKLNEQANAEYLFVVIIALNPTAPTIGVLGVVKGKLQLGS